MVKVVIKTQLSQLAGRTENIAKQMRYASALAMNSTMEKTKSALQREIKDVFDRPTPFTQDSIMIRYATRDNLRGTVMLKDFAGKSTPAADYLLADITGGLRKLKRFETLMTRAGIMPAGYRAVPGSAAQMDNFGNMNRGQLVQILSYFKTFPEAGYKANMTGKRKATLAKGSKKAQGYTYFVGRPGGRPLGVWQRVRFGKGTAVKPLIIFVPSAVYQPIFDFQYVAINTIKKHWESEFKQAFNKAMETAR